MQLTQTQNIGTMVYNDELIPGEPYQPLEEQSDSWSMFNYQNIVPTVLFIFLFSFGILFNFGIDSGNGKNFPIKMDTGKLDSNTFRSRELLLLEKELLLLKKTTIGPIIDLKPNNKTINTMDDVPNQHSPLLEDQCPNYYYFNSRNTEIKVN